MHRTLRTCLTLASLTIATPLVAGSPWISIELPANRINPETRDAYLVVRTYYHATPAQLVMRGTAEGLVNGVRRSRPLAFRTTGQTGVVALDRNWGNGGPWVLDIRAFNGSIEMSAVVGVGATGEAAFVRVPLSISGVPRTPTNGEVNEMLQALAQGRTPPPLAAAAFGVPWRHAALPLAMLVAIFMGVVQIGRFGVRRLRAAF